MKEKNSWELRSCKLTCQTVAKVSQALSGKKGGGGWEKQLNAVNRVNKMDQLFTLIITRKYREFQG